MAGLRIDYNQLSPTALNGVIEEFVTRDGTDYGKHEISLETKVSQVLSQIKSGKAVIVFDPELETCNILNADDPALKKMEA